MSTLSDFSFGAYRHCCDGENPPPSRAEAAMEAIEKLISDQGLKPGDPLPSENTLCAELGVSRSSVREALQQLQALDIVKVQHGRGAFVGPMSLRPLAKMILMKSHLKPTSLATLKEVVTTRKVLDLGMARELTNRFRGTHNPDLHELVDLMISRAEAGVHFYNEDIMFHRSMTGRVGSLIVYQLADVLWTIHREAYIVTPPDPTDLMPTALAHREMLIAAEAGDLNAFIDAIDAHYKPFTDMIEGLKKR